MAAQLFLITPLAADLEMFPKRLMAVLTAAEVSALLVRRGDRDEGNYAALVKALINIGQGAGCAVLVEGDFALARRLGADGVHVADIKSAREAVKALKPAMIVGAGPFATRHDAMTAGELDIDYLLFGSLADAATSAEAELAAWWAETFEIPAVFSDATAISGISHSAEFVALGEAFWATPDPAETLAKLAHALEQT